MDGVEESLENGRYKEPLDAYMDLSLIFWNGLFYNEPDSQIAIDASILKVSSVQVQPSSRLWE